MAANFLNKTLVSLFPFDNVQTLRLMARGLCRPCVPGALPILFLPL
jgi:hypothetical protein